MKKGNRDRDNDAGDQDPERWHADDVLETEVEVTCPYCGEVVAISLDAGGGPFQEYIEDCQVCCRPWQVRVHYGREGSVEVTVEASAG